MRNALVVAGLVIAALGAGTPALAQSREPAQLLFRGDDGLLRMARVPSLSELTAACDVARPPGVRSVLAASLVSGGVSQQVHLWVGPDGERVFLQSQGGPVVDDRTWCRLTDQAAASVLNARTLPANRGPWLGFIAAFGGVLLAIGLVALWAGGVGPLPRLETQPDPHEDVSGAHEDVGGETTGPEEQQPAET